MPRNAPTMALLGILLALAAVTGGCSMDRYTYHSTPLLPTTVQLVVVTSDQVVWTKEIPVNHKLVMDFDRKGEVELASTGKLPADSMKWKIVREGESKKVAHGELMLAGVPVMMKISYRKAPEYAPDYQGNAILKDSEVDKKKGG